MKVKIDYNRCIGAAVCVDICPEVFKLKGDGLVEVIQEKPAASLYEKVKEAASECPTEAIVIEED